MKNLLFMPIVFVLTVIAFLTSPESIKDYSNSSHIKKFYEMSEQKTSPRFEKEEYIIEDYKSKYVETDCQDCLNFSISDCSELDVACLETMECVNWFSCVGWCEADGSGFACYETCDKNFIESNELNFEVKLCVCSACSKECAELCGA